MKDPYICTPQLNTGVGVGCAVPPATRNSVHNSWYARIHGVAYMRINASVIQIHVGGGWRGAVPFLTRGLSLIRTNWCGCSQSSLRYGVHGKLGRWLNDLSGLHTAMGYTYCWYAIMHPCRANTRSLVCTHTWPYPNGRGAHRTYDENLAGDSATSVECA